MLGLYSDDPFVYLILLSKVDMIIPEKEINVSEFMPPAQSQSPCPEGEFVLTRIPALCPRTGHVMLGA